MGFVTGSHTIFEKLDRKRNGTLSYRDVVPALDAGQMMIDGQTSRMLTALVWSCDDESETTAEPHNRLETMSWRLRGTSASELRAELQGRLTATGHHVADLLRFFDQACRRRRAHAPHRPSVVPCPLIWRPCYLTRAQDTGDYHMVIDDQEFMAAMRNKLGACTRRPPTDHARKLAET
jgi:hypothetical protein